MPEPIITPEFQLAEQLVNTTDATIFLTGKAGTGKTTFLHYIQQHTTKRTAVVAPTGIAAINAGGATINSFFQLPFGPLTTGWQNRSDSKKYNFRKEKQQILRTLDLLIIDEVSMLSGDKLDAIDLRLRQYRDPMLPFGGVQLLLIGDLHQLAPVVKANEWELLRQSYDTQYFFSAHALQQTELVTIELTHIFRQSDDTHFIDILARVRDATADQAVLDELNKRYIPDFQPDESQGYVRLTTHVATAEKINQQQLEKLTTPSHTFQARISGDFPDNSYPNPAALELKAGAQVMFIKNGGTFDNRYYNGLIAEIVDFDTEAATIIVRTKDDNPRQISVGHEQWDNTRYTLNPTTNEIESETVGSYSQYPLKLAWAITVHKSQGLTFDRAIIDVQHSFTHGQTYVALSRCRTLAGLVLAAPVPYYAIINDPQVDRFAHDPRHSLPTEQRLTQLQQAYQRRTLDTLFDLNTIRRPLDAMLRIMREHFYDSQREDFERWTAIANTLTEQQKIADTFARQRHMIAADNTLLMERVKKGAAYFHQQLAPLTRTICATVFTTNNKAVGERLENVLPVLITAATLTTTLLEYVAQQGFDSKAYATKRAHAILDIEGNGNDRTHITKGKKTSAPKATKPKPPKRSKKISPEEWAKRYTQPDEPDLDDLPY